MKRAFHSIDACRPWIRTGLVACMLAGSGVVQAATITVDESVDDNPGVGNGSCSLREAVIAANTNAAVDGCAAGEPAPAVDEIGFDPATDGVPLELTRRGSAEDLGDTGDLDIVEDVIIRGNGMGTYSITDGFALDGTVIDADAPGASSLDDRVIDVHGGSVEIEGVVITGGRNVTQGGGIRLAAGASLILRDVGVTGNNIAFTGLVLGGGIVSRGDLEITGSVIATNGATATSASDNALGGGLAVVQGDAALDDVVLFLNRARTAGGEAFGGGVLVDTGGSFVLADSLVINNVAQAQIAGGAAFGGGMGFDGAGTVVRTSVAENVAGAVDAAGGGGIAADGALYLGNVTVSGNRAVSENGQASGGGLLGPGTVNNATVFGNEAEGVAGGGSPGGTGGGVWGTATLSNTVVAGNTATEAGPDCINGTTSDGYNLIGDGTDCALAAAAGDRVGTGSAPLDPLLGELEDNGGGMSIGGNTVPMYTHAPGPQSPLLDSANPNPVMASMPPACEPLDQRGESRPTDDDGDGGAVCDIGAFEGAVMAASNGGGGLFGPLVCVLLGLLALARMVATDRGRQAARLGVR